MISIDLGKEVAIALWKDNMCHKIVNYSFLDKRYVYENLMYLLGIVDSLILDGYNTVILERPSRDLYIQWAEYMDIRHLVEKAKGNFFSYVPGVIKKTVTGNGRAKKNEIEQAVLSSNYLLPEASPKTEHDFDSIAVGICYILKEDKN